MIKSNITIHFVPQGTVNLILNVSIVASTIKADLRVVRGVKQDDKPFLDYPTALSGSLDAAIMCAVQCNLQFLCPPVL